MRSVFFRALWLSSVATAELITITEWRKCSTSAVFPAPTFASNSTVSASSTSAAAASTSSSPPRLGSIGPGAGASVQTKDVDNLFWLNYARAITEIIPYQPGANSAFFIGSTALKGPVGGDGIAQEYTNFGLHDIANNLLNDSSPFYEPSGLNGYIETLRTFLAYVDTDAKPTPADQQNLNNAYQDLAAANARVITEGTAAVAAYNKQVQLGILDSLTHPLQQWIADRNYPSFNSAQKDVQAITTRIDTIRARIDGPRAVDLNNDRDYVDFGLSPDNYPGFNMLAATGNLQSARELSNCQALPPCPTPSNTFRLPLYASDRYTAFIKDAQTRSLGTFEPNSYEFKVDTSESASSFKFGQTTAGAAARGNWWFSFFSASGDRTTESSTANSESAASTTNIKITYDKLERVAVTPGKWNVNLNGYKLSKAAPANLRQLVRPTELVLASRLGYEITVGTAFAAQLDTHFKQTTKASGGFRIFGITIWGGSASKTDERNTHSATYNADTRTLKIIPDNDVGTATLVGVIGERINVMV